LADRGSDKLAVRQAAAEPVPQSSICLQIAYFTTKLAAIL